MNATNIYKVDKMYTVFVYGTLKKGFGNNILLENSLYLGTGKVINYALKYSHGDNGFPVMFKRKNNIVYGELYAVDNYVLSSLDDLEGEGTLYHRKKVRVITDTETLPAYTYIGSNFWKLKELTDVGKKEHNWNGKINA